MRFQSSSNSKKNFCTSKPNEANTIKQGNISVIIGKFSNQVLSIGRFVAADKHFRGGKTKTAASRHVHGRFLFRFILIAF